jgi:ABC-type nitrate/sulfonate/bicarbonate transport system ATPase subunit
VHAGDTGRACGRAGRPKRGGKTTLLNLAVGLTAPSTGEVTVLGGRLPGAPTALDGIAFVAQDTPLYETLPVADMLHLTRNLTRRRFDQPYAQARLAELGIPLKRKAGKLSGGQQAQLALTLALARRPQLLVLDEPVAMTASRFGQATQNDQFCWVAGWTVVSSPLRGRPRAHARGRGLAHGVTGSRRSAQRSISAVGPGS